LPSLSTGFDLTPDHRPDPRIRHELRRKRARFDRGDDDLPLSGNLPQEGRPTLGIELGKDVVQQEHRPLARATGHHRGLGQLQAHDGRPLLTLRAIGARLTTVKQNPQVVAVRPRVPDYVQPEIEAGTPVAGVDLTPNPVFAQLERAPPPPVSKKGRGRAPKPKAQ